MECGLPYKINKASRDKDMEKVESLGPLAAALSRIIHCTDIHCRNSEKDFIGFEQIKLYRGLKLEPEYIKQYKDMLHNYINL